MGKYGTQPCSMGQNFFMIMIGLLESSGMDENSWVRLIVVKPFTNSKM